MDGDMRITVTFTRDCNWRHARPPDPIDPVIIPLDITMNTDEVKIAAAAIAKATRAIFESGYLSFDLVAPSVNIELCSAGEWVTWPISRHGPLAPV